MDPAMGILLVLIVAAFAGVFYVVLNWNSPGPINTEPVLYAKKGEVITCTGGHEICELARDIFVGDTMIAEGFITWRNQDPAKPGDVIVPCKTCGEPFIKSSMSYGGSQLHIDGEWRTTREPPTYG
jgi:hypothetical protein